MLYARIVWKVHDSFGSNDIIQGNGPQATGLDVACILRGFELFVGEYPDDLAVLSEYCYLICLAGRIDVAKELFGRINNRVDPTIWSVETFKWARAWAFSR
jgi:hypothetical protein